MLTNLFSRKIIGERIRQIRKQKGLSGFDFAELLMCSQQHVSRIEAGLVRLSVAQLYLISNSLAIDIVELISNVGYQDNELLRIEKASLYYRAEEVY